MNWKLLGKKLLFPPVWLMLLLTAASAAGLIAVFVNGWESAPIAYVFYALSFYTLTVVTVFCVMVLPRQYRKIKTKILANPLGNRYAIDKLFRANISLTLSLSVNLLYAAVNALSWYLYQSWWFVCLAVYYGIMSLMRFLLVRYVRLNAIGANRCGELRRSLACSYIMLLLNFFLSGAVLMVVYQNKGFEYHGIMIYVMALFTFYNVTVAMIALIKYRRFESPVMSTAKVISLAAGLVSLLNLETAMFAEFGADMAKEDQQLMIMLTGGGIAVAVIAMAVNMIARCTKELKTMRRKNHGA
ncbi:MAG: hypothetical protein IJW94_03980 [Oscillospiraceae bacterium]|nr:hypothetical protein [Oscillospiraceae bacterium]